MGGVWRGAGPAVTAGGKQVHIPACSAPHTRPALAFQSGHTSCELWVDTVRKQGTLHHTTTMIRAHAAPSNAGHDVDMLKAKILPRSLPVLRIRQHAPAVLLILAFSTVAMFVSAASAGRKQRAGQELLLCADHLSTVPRLALCAGRCGTPFTFQSQR